MAQAKLSFHCLYVIFSRPTGYYVLNDYYVLSNIASVSYCYYTCELNILGTRIKVLVPLSQTGVWQKGRDPLAQTWKALEFGDREHSDWRTRCLLSCPARRGPSWCGSFKAGYLSLLFGSREVLKSRVAWFIILRDPLQTGAPLLPSREWWGHPWHWEPDPSHSTAGGVDRV
jgi:hypothetical protein